MKQSFYAFIYVLTDLLTYLFRCYKMKSFFFFSAKIRPQHFYYKNIIITQVTF